MKRLITSIALASLLLAGLLLQGCGRASPPAGSSGGVTVTDALGNSVHFARLPRRVAVAGKNALPVIEALYLFPEASERVVDTVVGKQKPGDFLPLIDPAFGQKTALQTDAGPEQVSALQPDVVLMKSVNAETLGEPLKALGIPVISLDLETPEQFKRDIAVLGQLLGNPARSQEILSFYQAKLDAVSKGLEGLAAADRPSTLLVQYSDTGGEIALSVPSAAYLQTVEVELAGGEPAWKEAAQGGGWNVVNLEQVAAWNPEFIFVIYYGGDPQEIVEHLKADSRWQPLKAVQAGRIYGFAGDVFSWDQPDPRWILAVTWLAGKLHPDRFPGLDIQQEAARFFQEMYGMDAASFEASILPRLKGDVK